MPSAHSSLRCMANRRFVSSARPYASIGLKRFVHISSTPSISPIVDQDLSPSSTAGSSPAPDARFEVIGSPFSLLSVSLSASQNLYTRRGTLVGVSGAAENTVSTLSLLEPFRRAFLGIPFFYQRKISSTTPITTLISTKAPISSIAVVHLDGRQDWVVSQRNALLAWTGHALAVKPKLNTEMSIAHWGSSQVTGRGLMALVGKGQLYQVQLRAGESYIVHPSHIVAYELGSNPPLPYRFKSTALRFQIPKYDFGPLVESSKFLKTMAETATWRTITGVLFALRTWLRRTIWGDRLFLEFQGPSTLIMQSRGSSIRDVLTARDVNEIADSPPGPTSSRRKTDTSEKTASAPASALSIPQESETHVRYATVGRDGKVKIDDR
ncbi:altered inheritance of mitochondria protein 24, mitochondrial [Lophium mytilinum]|uniref:Altered inheritance of mitochondria protein 24, mitochondrial n=1 Tax=Lophium mytilinum TaxID=390894 RepID=A0A6A6QTW4_9PEZI|nr:altered inheritance of mitochondria protein 24, mitochondrial [Lophium mytilinum]